MLDQESLSSAALLCPQALSRKQNTTLSCCPWQLRLGVIISYPACSITRFLVSLAFKKLNLLTTFYCLVEATRDQPDLPLDNIVLFTGRYTVYYLAGTIKYSKDELFGLQEKVALLVGVSSVQKNDEISL
jgi:hypothetical protein